MRGYRVGVVNPRAAFAARVRDLLSEQRLPVIELKLFEAEARGEATLTRFQDEVVVTQALDSDLFAQLDVLFFAGRDTDLVNRMALEAGDAGVLTLIEGALSLEAPVAAPGLNDAELSRESGVIIVPRMSSYLLGATLSRVRSVLPITRASATVLVPAGARGDGGAEELHQQVINILNFKEPPKEVFREQVAFNVQLAGEGVRAPLLAETVAREAAGLSGLEDALTVSLVQVPVFHGFAASIWIELEAPAEQRTIASCFSKPPFNIETGRTAKPPSAIGVAESDKIHVGGIRRPSEISRPGFWVWVAADTTAYDAGAAAVDLAKAALG